MSSPQIGVENLELDMLGWWVTQVTASDVGRGDMPKGRREALRVVGGHNRGWYRLSNDHISSYFVGWNTSIRQD